jgi:hypothetical protein
MQFARSVGAVAAAALALSAAAYAQKPDHYQLRHTADLVTVCSMPSSSAEYATAVAFCHGVLAGAWGYYVASTAPLEREICPADTALTRAKVAEAFVAWARARPQHMQANAVDTLFRFAAEAYPCKR